MADGKSYERAKEMRRRLTPPEARLWRGLKGDQLGVGFRKQHPVGPYILDFYCAAAKLAVEVDGAGHWEEAQAEHDRRRTVWLAGKGIRVVRIAALDVRDQLEDVLEFIGSAARKRISTRPADD